MTNFATKNKKHLCQLVENSETCKILMSSYTCIVLRFSSSHRRPTTLMGLVLKFVMYLTPAV